MKINKEDITIVLLTGLGVNYRFLLPHQLYLKNQGWKCEIVSNTAFTTNTIKKYSHDLKDILNNCNKAILIGMSLGGVISAFTIADSEKYCEKVLRAYTICSPVGGPSDWLKKNPFLNFMVDIPVPDKVLPKSLATFRRLLLSFRADMPKTKIHRSKEKIKNKLVSLFHKNDKISPIERSYLEGEEGIEIKYNYDWIPKLFHHHVACADPRVYLDILEEIEKDFG